MKGILVIYYDVDYKNHSGERMAYHFRQAWDVTDAGTMSSDCGM